MKKRDLVIAKGKKHPGSFFGGRKKKTRPPPPPPQKKKCCVIHCQCCYSQASTPKEWPIANTQGANTQGHKVS